MNNNILVMMTRLSFLVSMGIFFAQENTGVVPQNVLPDEMKWLNYPKAEHMFTLEEIQAHHASGACKAFKEHQLNQPTSGATLWKLKHDELHAQCSIETIEQTIARLQEQLKKDREQLKKAKTEQDKFAQP